MQWKKIASQITQPAISANLLAKDDTVFENVLIEFGSVELQSSDGFNPHKALLLLSLVALAIKLKVKQMECTILLESFGVNLWAN